MKSKSSINGNSSTTYGPELPKGTVVNPYAVKARTSVSGDLAKVWTKYDSTFKDEFARRGVPWQWGKAIALNESDLGLDPRVVRGEKSGDGLSYGLMQFILSTARNLLGYPAADAELIRILNDPSQAIWLAAKFLAELKVLVKNAPGGATTKNVIVSYNQSYARTVKGEILPAAEIYWQRFSVHLALVEANQ